MPLSSAPSVVVVGSLNADIVVRTERFPQPGETLAGGELRIISGGKGANQAVAAAKLGARVNMVGAVGDDSNGELLRASIVRAGVNDHGVRTDPSRATGTAVITVDAAGENTIIVSPGANGGISAASVQEAADSIRSGAVLCLCLEISLDAVAESVRIASESGVRVVLNLSPSQTLPEDVIRMVDVLLVNEHELADLIGDDAVEAGWSAVAEQLTARGVSSAVVTLGARGCVVLDNGTVAAEITAPVVTAVDTTGAGDAFAGAIAAQMASGESLVAAARVAVTAGSFAATGEGAQASYATWEQLAEFARTH
ncbi:MAG: ribokinase [Mycetocola sp.]